MKNMEDSIIGPADIKFQQPPSKLCCVCLKILPSCQEGPAFHRAHIVNSTTVQVCSFLCEQSVLHITGFVQGFALSSILLHFFTKLLTNDALPNNAPGTVADLKFFPLATKDNNSTIVFGSCESAVPDCEAKDCGEIAADLKDSVSADLAHAASYDSSTECESLDLDVSFRETEISTKVSPVFPKKGNAQVPRKRTAFHRTRDPNPKSKTKKRLGVSKDKKSAPKFQTQKASKTKNGIARLQRVDHENKKTLPLEKDIACASSHPKKKLLAKSVHGCECGEVFTSKKRLKKHQKSHGGKTEDASSAYRPACEVCAREFQSRWHLNYHTKRKHSGEGHRECDVCGKLLSGAFDFSEHKRKAHSIHCLCDICGSRFFSSSALAGHLATHTGIKSFFCEECGMGFVRKTSLTNHQALHAKVAAFLCHVCSQSFKTRARLYDHMMNLHHSGPYFDNRVRRLKTMGIQVDREAVSKLANGLCAICSEKLTNGRCTLHPGSVQQAFKCTLCGKSENDIVSLYYHSKWHKGEAEESSSMSSTSLPSHGLLSYECRTCFKKFKNKNYLLKHMQQHRDKRFSCDVCGKSFTYKCNLKSHLTAHSQSRPFECGVCHKAFKLKYTLDVHRRHHCREVDAFKCQVCGKGLIRKESLIKHYRMVHPESHFSIAVDTSHDS